MNIIISVHGRFHAFELAKGLFQNNLLEILLTTYPRFVVHSITKSKMPVSPVSSLEFIRRITNNCKLLNKSDLFISKKFAKFSANYIKMSNQAGILVGWSSATLEAISPAKSNGKKIIIERGSTHILEQEKILKSAEKELGLSGYKIETEIIDREIEEYERADRICVPSQVAAKSFLERGFSKKKVIINPLGVNLELFQKPKEKIENKKPIVMFAGSLGVRKGLPWLLRACSSLSQDCDLHLFGNLEKNFNLKNDKGMAENVKNFGPVSTERLISEYKKADIFCLPSIEEGFGMVVLQAMAMGIPVVVTETVGAASIIEDGVTGILVPPCDEVRLKCALESLIFDKAKRLSMGEAGCSSVKLNFSWQNYITRSIQNYKQILAS